MSQTKGRVAGFTLLELLAVVAIIAILATIAAVGISSAVKRGRDAVRERDLTNVKQALELYNQDTGSYPHGNGGNYLSDLAALKSEGYLNEIPDEKNPKSGSAHYNYVSDADDSNYVLLSDLEYDSARETLTGLGIDCSTAATVANVGKKGNGIINPTGVTPRRACFHLTND